MSDASSQEIERSLERDRMALAQSLVDLRERLTPSALIGEGKAAFMDRARPMAAPMIAKLDGVVRGQPLVAAVAGVALAALVFGRRASASDTDDAPTVAGTKYAALTRWEDEGGPPAPDPLELEEDWLGDARGLRHKASALLSQIDHAARRRLAPAAELARHRAEVVAALGRDTTAALGKGLEALSEAARGPALQAREQLYLSRIVLVEKGREAVEGHPVAVAAAVAAAGAALAWMFPTTETEDRLMGETRDKMLQDLRKTAFDEVSSASEMARSIASALGRDIRQIDSTLRPEHAWSGADVRH